MPDHKLTLEVYGIRRTSVLQMSINRRAADGTGDGYRLAGPSFNGTGEMLLRRELTGQDAREIRDYLDDAFPLTRPAGSPLTCTGCALAPATALMVLGRTNSDRTPAPGNVLVLHCRDCAGKARVIADVGGRAVKFFAIGPEDDING
jgi:hypothetical protein